MSAERDCCAGAYCLGQRWKQRAQVFAWAAWADSSIASVVGKDLLGCRATSVIVGSKVRIVESAGE